MDQGLTVVQTARIVGGVHWVTTRLFEILGGWAGESDRPDIAVSLATSSRHLGWHTSDLEELLPDSVLLEDHTTSMPHTAELGPALEAIAAIPGSIERLAVAHRVLLARLAAHCVAVERAGAPHADASMTRVISFLLADLRRDRDDGEALLARLFDDLEVVERVHARMLDAESRLVAVGGLFPVTVTG